MIHETMFQQILREAKVDKASSYSEENVIRLLEATLTFCAESICRSDPSEKMILHEPYRTVMTNMYEFFEQDLND